MPQTIQTRIANTGEIKGTISGNGAVRGTISTSGGLSGTLSVGSITVNTVADYEGSYDVTPLITSQILQTQNKRMVNDLTIEMIPTREINNAYGGVTFIVG